MHNKVDNLTNFERDLLIHWFMHKMDMEQRYDLMEDLPKIYFKMTGVKAKLWTKQEGEE